MALQFAVDSNAISHGLYIIENPVVRIHGSSLFFVTGPVFTIGVLLAKYHPGKRWITVLYVFVLSVLYSIQELILLFSGSLRYLNWNYLDSIIVNFCALVSLSWFAVIVLGKGRESK